MIDPKIAALVVVSNVASFFAGVGAKATWLRLKGKHGR